MNEKEIFQAFPINTVIQWNSSDSGVDERFAGWVVGYLRNNVGELLLEIMPITRNEGSMIHLHPGNAITQVTAVISGAYVWGRY